MSYLVVPLKWYWRQNIEPKVYKKRLLKDLRPGLEKYFVPIQTLYFLKLFFLPKCLVNTFASISPGAFNNYITLKIVFSQPHNKWYNSTHMRYVKLRNFYSIFYLIFKGIFFSQYQFLLDLFSREFILVDANFDIFCIIKFSRIVKFEHFCLVKCM